MEWMTDWLRLAFELHSECLVVDGHADTPQRFVDEAFDWTGPLNGGQLSAEAARKGGMDGEFFALWAEPRQWSGKLVERTESLLRGVEEQLALHPDVIVLCRTGDEVRQARRDGRFAALLGIEGGHSIGNSLDFLREFFALGVRYMTLTWSNSNDWCDSSGEESARHNGINAFGREVIAEMNRLGMLVDISHVSDAAFWQALEASRAPVIASHSSARALTHSARNLTDDMLRAVAAKGGVVMVNFNAAFVDETHRQQWSALHDKRAIAEERLNAEWRERNAPVPYRAEMELAHTFLDRAPRPPLASLIAHFDHILRVCGPAHVGIGSDFDGIPAAPVGIDSAADLPRITAGLLELGWSPDELRGMLGENVLRVLDQAQV